MTKSAWPVAMELLTLTIDDRTRPNQLGDRMAELSHAEAVGACLWLATMCDCALDALAEARPGRTKESLVQGMALALAEDAPTEL